MAFVFLDLVMHLLAFDLGYIFLFFANNIVWVFGFLAGSYYLFSGKNFAMGAILYGFLFIVFFDFITFTGFVYFTAAFLSLMYLARMSTAIFTENVDVLRPYLPMVVAFTAIFLILVYNIWINF